MNCASCPNVYVGLTGRSFKKPYAEHKWFFIIGKTASNYLEHLYLEIHNFNKSFDVLHNENIGPIHLR